MRSRSPKSNQLLSLSMQVWWHSIHWFRSYRGYKNLSRRRRKFNSLRPPVTLKMGSESPKLNQLFDLSQWCIHASLVKFHPLIQEIWWIPIVRPTPGIRTETNMYPLTFGGGGGHNKGVNYLYTQKHNVPVKSVGCMTIDVYCSKMRDCFRSILTSNLEMGFNRNFFDQDRQFHSKNWIFRIIGIWKIYSYLILKQLIARIILIQIWSNSIKQLLKYSGLAEQSCTLDSFQFFGLILASKW